jgi:hypothetical protein
LGGAASRRRGIRRSYQDGETEENQAVFRIRADYLRQSTAVAEVNGPASPGAAANHCAFVPMSSSTVAAHKDELNDYDTSKGTIRFQADKPLPVALVRKLVKARIAENVGRRRK